MTDFEVQTRSEDNGCRYWPTVAEAVAHADQDLTVWKVSFNAGRERIRLVRRATSSATVWRSGWVYDPIVLPEKRLPCPACAGVGFTEVDPESNLFKQDGIHRIMCGWCYGDGTLTETQIDRAVEMKRRALLGIG